MFTFHIAVHARSPEVSTGQEVLLNGQQFQTLNAPAAALTAPFPVTFEQAGEALSNLERLYFEPDGSFVWVSGSGEPKWQVDGNLFDRDGRLLFVDLKGTCPGEQFDQLLSAFGWPETPVMVQPLREAVFLNEDDFRRFAQASSDASRPMAQV
jgi:hypothetical protein